MQNSAEFPVVQDEEWTHFSTDDNEDTQSSTSLLSDSPSTFRAIQQSPDAPNSVRNSECGRILSGSPANCKPGTLQTPLDTFKCCVCFDIVPPCSGVTCCDSASASEAVLSHFYCNTCFSDKVVSQVTGECKAAFIQHGLTIECSICKSQGFRSVFDMQMLCSHLTRDAYTHYIKVLSEPSLIEAEQRFQGRVCELQERIDLLECKTYINHIQEHLIQPRCPRLDCKALLLDFDHCAHLQVSVQ